MADGGTCDLHNDMGQSIPITNLLIPVSTDVSVSESLYLYPVGSVSLENPTTDSGRECFRGAEF